MLTSHCIAINHVLFYESQSRKKILLILTKAKQIHTFRGYVPLTYIAKETFNCIDMFYILKSHADINDYAIL